MDDQKKKQQQDLDKYLNESFKKVQLFINEGKFDLAMQGARELKKLLPNHSEINKLYNKVDGLYRGQLDAVIEKELIEVNRLVQANDYESALKLLVKLKKLNPSNPVVTKMLNKIEKSYYKSEKKRWNEYIRKAFADISDYYDDEDWGKASDALHELYKVIPQSPQLAAMLDRAKRLYVENTIYGELVAKLEKEKQWEKLYMLYKKLNQINPGFKPLIRRLNKAEKHLNKLRTKEKHELLKKGMTRIEALYNEGKFEDALEGIKEIKIYDAKNVDLSTLQSKIMKANKEDTEKKVQIQMKAGMDILSRFSDKTPSIRKI